MKHHRDNPHFQKISALKIPSIFQTQEASQGGTGDPLGRPMRLHVSPRWPLHIRASRGKERHRPSPPPPPSAAPPHFQVPSCPRLLLGSPGRPQRTPIGRRHPQEGGAGRGHLDWLAAPVAGGPDWLEAQRKPAGTPTSLKVGQWRRGSARSALRPRRDQARPQSPSKTPVAHRISRGAIPG